jgi:predicted XRE-type DNA-binding protein
MARSITSRSSANFFADLGIAEPDVELAKADLALRIQRLVEHRRLAAGEAAALLKVPESDLPALFEGRLATCSLDQLLRMLTWLGDDVEILIRPRLQRTERGALRMLQAAAVERPEDFEPVRLGSGKRLSASSRTATASGTADENATLLVSTQWRPPETRRSCSTSTPSRR